MKSKVAFGRPRIFHWAAVIEACPEYVTPKVERGRRSSNQQTVRSQAKQHVLRVGRIVLNGNKVLL